MKNIRHLVVPAFLAFATTLTFALRAGAAEPLIPGSATLAPKAIDQPVPPKSEGLDLAVRVGVWIRPDGTVEEAQALQGPEVWRAAAVSAAQGWRFEPVMWNGRAIEARAEIDFQNTSYGVFATVNPLPNLPGESHTEKEFGLTKPKLKREPDLVYPLAVRIDGRRLATSLQYTVGEEGTVVRVEALGTTSEVALRGAFDVVQAMEFVPGKLRDRPVRVDFKQIIGYTTSAPKLPELAGATEVVDPAYPYERLIAKEEGHALVRFTLNEQGLVASTEIVEASHPDFGNALVAAVESWTFAPEAVAENRVREYRHDFIVDSASYGSRRFATIIREGGTISASAQGLDNRPKMLAAPQLAYPKALSAAGVTEGAAKIEFVVDRAGLAQLPRVIESTHPEFGWAALTFVNSMRFTPLTREGQPAEILVSIPIKFSLPKETPGS